MHVTIRNAELSDLEAVAALLVADGSSRHDTDPVLWKLSDNATERARSSVEEALTGQGPPFRQKWLVAETDAGIVGVAHTILLPVPPIYAGAFGPPGLLMEDCCLSDEAPDGTLSRLIEAAEDDLVAAGARILLGSSVADGDWGEAYRAIGYAPLTLYLAKSCLDDHASPSNVDPATSDDIAQIVRSSSQHRRILADLNPFWTPHEDADKRFGGWMTKSLDLPGRDMFIARSDEGFAGYIVAQPATALHFPPVHDISATGLVDDFHHIDLGEADNLKDDGTGALALLAAAEGALAARGNQAAIVVCPAAWTSKVAAIEAAGYRPAITWFIRWVSDPR